VLAGALLAALAAAPAGGAAAAPVRTVSVADFRFVPAVVTAAPGTRMLFRWRGRAPHDVRAVGPAAFASRIQTVGTFAVRLTRKGTYRITCSIHPQMRLVLRVG